MSIKLSIVIPNYNYGYCIDQFFRSILTQTYPLDAVEILFVDDGSDDDSLVRAHEWSKTVPCRQFFILTPLRTGKPGVVRNYGLEQARGELLLSLDPDDVLQPDFIGACVAHLDTYPDVDVVYTDYLECRSETNREVVLPDFNPGLLRTQNPLLQAAMYRRKLWDDGVRYRDNTSYEDWDFWIQCQMIGARFARIPRSLYIYNVHDGGYSEQAIADDGPAKAVIVCNNPIFFHPEVITWAESVLRRRLHSQSMRRGYIPTPVDIRKVLDVIERRLHGSAGE